MGLFSRLFKSEKGESKQADNEKQNFSYVSEIAGLITGNNGGFMKRLNDFLIYTQKECEEEDRDFEYWSGMYYQLEEEGYLISVDYKCELEDFLWALEQLETYNLIDIDLSSLNLNKNEDINAWGEEINLALNGRAYICMIDIDSDSYELIIVTADVYDKIFRIAQSNGHTIESF